LELLELLELFELFFDLLDLLPDGSSFDEHEGTGVDVGADDILGFKLGVEVTDGSAEMEGIEDGPEELDGLVEMEGIEEGLEVLDGIAVVVVCAKVIFEVAARERSTSAALLDGTVKGLIVFWMVLIEWKLKVDRDIMSSECRIIFVTSHENLCLENLYLLTAQIENSSHCCMDYKN